MKKISITDIERIGEILDYVHDRYFDLDTIQFNQDKQTFLIPLSVELGEKRIRQEIKFFIFQMWGSPVVKTELVFKNVTAFTMKDEAEIGEADINIIYQKDNQLIIECGIPVTIKLDVTACEIDCIISDTVIDEERSFEFRDFSN